jgi:two-component system, LytTR family, sensor kinase
LTALKHNFYLLALVCLFSLRVSAQGIRGVDSLYEVLRTAKHDTIKVHALNGIAKRLRNTEITKSLEMAREAYDISVKSNYTYGVASSSDIMGVIYANFGDYQKALYHHLVALNLFEKINDQKGIAFSYNNIGAVYSHLKNYPKAEYYYLKSLNLKKQAGLNKEVSSSYVNLGNIKMYQDQLDECIRYYQMGLANAIQYNDESNITISYMNLGEAYYDTKKLNIALRYYQKAIPMISKSGNKYHEGQTYFAIAKIYTDMKEFRLAETNFGKALLISEETGIKPLELNIYKYLSRLYEQEKKPEKAVRYLKKYIVLNDSIYTKENTKTISEMQTRYDVERKDRQIELLNKDKMIADSTIIKNRLVRDFLIAGFVLFIIIVIVLVRNIYLKQHVNRVLTEKNKEIQEQQEEIARQNEQLTTYNKELMKENIAARYEILKAKVNPHFLFNSLSTLANLILGQKEKALEFVSRFSKLYRRILELEDLQLVTIKEELDFVSEYLYIQKIRFRDNLVYDFKVDEMLLIDLIPPFSIQLLVENAIKHNKISNENKLLIKVYSENDCIMVVNNLQKKEAGEDSMKTGQKNILDRYRLISRKTPVFLEDDVRYLVSLPIIRKGELV